VGIATVCIFDQQVESELGYHFGMFHQTHKNRAAPQCTAALPAPQAKETVWLEASTEGDNGDTIDHVALWRSAPHVAQVFIRHVKHFTRPAPEPTPHRREQTRVRTCSGFFLNGVGSTVGVVS